MYEIRVLKKNARQVLRRNYFMIVIAAFLTIILLGMFHNPVDFIEDNIMPYFPGQEKALLDDSNATIIPRFNAPSTTEIVTEFLENVGAGNTTAKHWTAGALSAVATATEGTGNIVTGVLNVINRFVFRGSISSGIVVASGMLTSLVLYVLIVQVFLVGFYRFMLESRRYTKTTPQRVLFPWSVKRGLRVAWVMFVRRMYEILWFFTIAGGIIKHYSYYMVPFIMAENPDISAKEAINLSRRMMDGYKWKTFLFDLSYMGWFLLGMFSFSLLDIFYTRPYKYAATAEMYMFLRANAKKENFENAYKLCDDWLEGEVCAGVYPTEMYHIPASPARQWITSDYQRDYSPLSLIMMFFSFAIIGWAWEVIVFLFTDGEFINRGTSYGPWLPIYGFGGLIILVALKKFRDKPPLLFGATMLICGIMEYVTGWLLEAVKGMKYWDYTGYFMNIQGRVCLEGLLVFAIAGLAVTYIIAPALDDLYKKIPRKLKIAICAVLIILFVTDNIIAFFVPNVGRGITEYEPQTALQMLLGKDLRI